MRQIVDTYNVYKFDELNKEAQERALEWFRENEDFPFLKDDLSYKLEDLLKQHKIKFDELPKLYFSLSYSQGDGAMFEGTVYWKSYTVDIKHIGRYTHYNSKTFDMNSTKTDKEASNDVEMEFNDLYIDICQELEKYGYNLIEATLEDEAIIDMIDANEYEFTANGAIYAG